MLNCVYHPIDDMRVVENEERERLLASGFWFDSPVKAKAAREKIEQEIKDESKPEAIKPKGKTKVNSKLEDKDHEK